MRVSCVSIVFHGERIQLLETMNDVPNCHSRAPYIGETRREPTLYAFVGSGKMIFVVIALYLVIVALLL